MIFADTFDMLAAPSRLRNVIKRETFNPENQDHLDSLETFLQTGNWGTVQFYCEAPYTDVPMTVLRKFALNKLQGAKRSSAFTKPELEGRSSADRAEFNFDAAFAAQNFPPEDHDHDDYFDDGGPYYGLDEDFKSGPF